MISGTSAPEEFIPTNRGASFTARNAGKTQVGSALSVEASGGRAKLPKILERQKDGRTPFETAVSVQAATDTAIALAWPVAGRLRIELVREANVEAAVR